jgi:hypothetical protein
MYYIEIYNTKYSIRLFYLIAGFRFLYFLLHCSVYINLLIFCYEHVRIKPGIPGDGGRFESLI